MELRHLRYFVAVAEAGHVTRAAAQLGIQQPPLSQQIRALERELDVRLFHRLPRGVRLTDAGAALLDDARAILARVDHAVAATRRTARGEQGRIAVGFTSSVPFHVFVPRLIRAFRETHPLVALSLEESGTGELVDGVRGERIDVAFIRSPVADPGCVLVNALLEEEMVADLPGGHALAPASGGNDAALPLARLAAETFILYRRPLGPGLYDRIIAACHAAGFSPQVGQEAPRILSTLSFVAAGLGVSIVPASLRRLQLDGVAYRRIAASRPLKAPLNLASRRGETSTAVRRFIDLARRTAKELRQDGAEGAARG
jgi:DNA-binding transcriptional LysR family regulator